MSLNEANNQRKEGERCSSTTDGKANVGSCKKQTYVCGGCNASFERLRLLKKHRCCNGNDSSVCEKDKSVGSKCGKQEKDAVAIDVNAEVPSTEEPKAPLPKESKAFQCSACPKKFKKLHSLTRHFALSHDGIMPWKCPSCSEEFLSSVKFKEHCKEHGILKPFKCEKCKSFFKSYEVLRVHDRIHTGERPFSCRICDKTFKQRSNLQDHIRKHKNDRSFICGTCGKSFNLKGDLTKHLLLHTGEKKFQCQYCPKAFPGVSNFNRHMRTHTGVKPYTCSFCQKSFPRKEKMKEHERTHTGERPFTCVTCGKSFSDSGNFSNHKKGHEDASLRKWKRFPRRSTSSFSCGDASKSHNIGGTAAMGSHLRPEGLCSIAPSQPVRILFACPSQLICFPNSQGLEPVICVVDKGNVSNSAVNLAESHEATDLPCQQQVCVPMNLNPQGNVESYSQPSSEAVSEMTMCTIETSPSDISTISIAKDGERIAHTTDNSLMPFGLVRSVDGHPFADSFPLQENFPNVILTPTKFLPVVKTLLEDSSKEACCPDKEKGTNLETSVKDTNSAAANEEERCKSFDLPSSSTSGIPEKYCAPNLKLIDLTRTDDTQSYNCQSGCPLSPAVDSERRKLSGILFTTPTKSYPEEKIHSPSAMMCSQVLVTPEHASLHVDKIDQAKVKRRALEL